MKPAGIPLVVMIDDDVLFPRTSLLLFFVCLTLLIYYSADIDLRGGYEQIMYDDKVKAVAFTIRGIEESNVSTHHHLPIPLSLQITKTNFYQFWQKFQHLEYMQAGLLKMFQGNFGSVLTCHGAISLWEVQACCDVSIVLRVVWVMRERRTRELTNMLGVCPPQH